LSGLRTGAPRFEQALADRLDVLRRLALGPEHAGAALEGPPVVDTEEGRGRVAVLRAEHAPQLVGRPHVGQPFLAQRVGVERGREPALRQQHVGEQEVERRLRNPAVARVAGDGVAVQVRRGEQGVVVEHLLEVRDQPALVDGVAREPAGQHVVHAAGRHPVKRAGGDLEGTGDAAVMGTQQELDGAGGRKLRRAAEAAPLRVVDAAHPGDRRDQRVLAQRAVRAGDPAELVERRGQPPRRVVNLGAPVAVGLGDRLEHHRERRHPVPRLGRVVRPAEERPPLGRQEDGHRPAALAGQADDGVHVDGVDVGPLLAIDLDVDEQAVHQLGGRGILEGLVRHHVAPVARRVADRQQDRAVALPRRGQRLLPPRVPVDRVRRMLQQVRARLAGQAIHGYATTCRIWCTITITTEASSVAPAVLSISRASR
jgi:hypothetical protein